MVPLLLTFTLSAMAQSPAVDPLAAGFLQPPDPAKPLVLWQWMNGCVSKEGITADLESYQRAGLGGVQQFLIGGNQAILDDPTVQVLNPKWRGLMSFAITECARLGLSFGTHNGPGWSASGGPWVKVEQSMQKLVWSRTEFTGPGEFSGLLARAAVDPKWNFYRDVAVLAVPSGDPIARRAVVDLSAGMNPDGQLHWQAPAGQWTILRFGHTTTGQMNDATAPPSGSGLQCDMMSRDALEAFWAAFPAEVVRLAGPQAGKAFKRFEIDSYEAGPQDWTPAMREEFRKRRGYDLLPWLPALTRRTVESPELTARFQRDWKQTITDLFAENYYGYITALTHRVPGMEMMIEPYATGRGGAPYEPLGVAETGDLLMCEFWQKPAQWGWDSVKPVASAAHRRGKSLVVAEAFTGQPQYGWQQAPYSLKSTGDRAFCEGVNQFALHASAHNPWPHARPGMTMGWWGTQFGPGQTWWEHGGPEWLAYLARCQYLLQQGVFAGDLCYFLNHNATPKMPPGHDGDILGEQDVLTRLSVADGQLTLPDGTRYHAMVLPESDLMTPQIAGKIQRLVQDGATVIGGRPVRSPSLENYPACDQEVARIATEVWGDAAEAQERRYGKGRVVWGKKPDQVLAEAGIGPDVQLDPKSPLLWIHRRLPGAEIYFVSNQQDEPLTTTIGFRVTGRRPELWHADTGEMEAAGEWSAAADRTDVKLTLDPAGSMFVVFRQPSDGATSHEAAAGPAPARLAIEGAWELHFPADSGAPESVLLDPLISWAEHPAPGVKYFSGTATYVKEIDVPAEFLAGSKRLTIDLGKVRQVASVRANDRAFPALWKPPFRCDLTGALHPGKNRIEIRVTNLWPNRLIGDEQEPDDCDWGEPETFAYVKPPVVVGRRLLRAPSWLVEGKPRPSSRRFAFTTFKFFTRDSPLLESGLLGPVTLESTD